MDASPIPQAKALAVIPAMRSRGEKAPEKTFVDFPV
jgi:hypothetical protein